MTDPIEANRRLWNMWTPHHLLSPDYNVEAFKAGQSRLKPVEVEEMGDVSGKWLLHLQCHFGLDTLSWARRGAIVTGADLSDASIEAARWISAECGIPATFIRSNLYDLPEVLDERFDIVYTSFGALYWLPDMPRWGEIVAHFLKPGGTFYVIEFHPMHMVFDGQEPDLRIAYPYFHAPVVEEVQGSYATDAPVRGTEHGWAHSIADIVNALLDSGLRLEFLHEFPRSPFPFSPFTKPYGEGWYGSAYYDGRIPMLFSIKATKPG